MNSKNLFSFVIATLALVSTASGAAAAGPRNVILIIGDGMDDHQITIARNYLVGARGRLILDAMALRSTAQVLTVSDDEPERAVYVADSANTATALATGVVTARGRLATTAGTDRDITTIIELAEAAGMKTGIVSTASITDATPASFIAHISLRFCENPDAMEEVVFRGIHLGSCSKDLKRNGGLGSIAEQIADSGVDVVLGGGAEHFAPKAEGQDRSVLETAIAGGFHLVTSASELAAAPKGRRLLGLFSPSHLPVRWQGEGGRIAEKPETSILHRFHRYLGEVTFPEPMKCEANPAATEVPSLKQMTDAALEHLADDGSKGFFLTIESASIDKQSHARNACGSIGELEQLEEALESALAFAKTHPDTLILVTADHGQAAQLVPNESLFAGFGIPVYSPGRIVRLTTREGAIMVVNYATNDFSMEEHTGVNVPLFANEVGVGRVPTMVTQPEIFEIMAEYLGLGGRASRSK
jgi:alkaline phosphatase